MEYYSASLHLRSILAAIDAIADEAGLSSDVRSNLNLLLLALPDCYRARVRFTLEVMRAFSDDVAFHAAVNLMSRRAAELWSTDVVAPAPPQRMRQPAPEPQDMPGAFAAALAERASALLRRVPLPHVA